MAAIVSERIADAAPAGAVEGSRFGAILALWMVLAVGLRGTLWLAGFPGGALAEAVERGAAKIESRGIGEVSDDLIRKAIETQHGTLPFWTTLAVIGDFLVEPFALAARMLAVATALGALAALVGRPVRFERALDECAAIQGVWVLGLAVQAALMVALRRGDVETSLAVFAPSGAYWAPAWLALRQLDAFAILGWVMLARAGWRRGQANLAAAAVVCAGLGLGEAALRVGLGLVIGSAMRLDMIPG